MADVKISEMTEATEENVTNSTKLLISRDDSTMTTTVSKLKEVINVYYNV